MTSTFSGTLDLADELPGAPDATSYDAFSALLDPPYVTITDVTEGFPPTTFLDGVEGESWIELAGEGDLYSYQFVAANYPNPFNPQTTIAFALPRAAEVSLTVFDVLGREVARLVDGVREAGWQEVRFGATSLPSGTYFYRLAAGDFVQTRSMMLVR